MLLDEFFSRFDLVSHKQLERGAGTGLVLGADSQQRALLGSRLGGGASPDARGTGSRAKPRQLLAQTRDELLGTSFAPLIGEEDLPSR